MIGSIDFLFVSIVLNDGRGGRLEFKEGFAFFAFDSLIF